MSSAGAVGGDGDEGSPQKRRKVSTAGPVRSVEGWYVFVSGLHQDVTEEVLLDTFTEVGSVKRVRMNRDQRSRKCKGYALVEFEKQSHAQDAINEKHGMKLLDKAISVEWTFVRGTDDRVDL